jgi:two-component system sensor histidine kinase UhpB
LILFRSIRELLINAAKHAGAHRVHVRLQHVKGRLNALVEDDGVGMEPGAGVAKGSGLFSIQERMAHVGGSMRIQSNPGLGTKISLCAPSTDSNTRKAGLEA